MKKILASLVMLSALAGGCGERWDRLWDLKRTMDEMSSYESSPEEKARDMRETRYELDKVRKLVEKNLGSGYRR
jgi:hypothetical protein|tara:strand:+ start:365 stop:586 length:222 start_codon:yes stop_codon:yes gene_type:complete